MFLIVFSWYLIKTTQRTRCKKAYLKNFDKIEK